MLLDARTIESETIIDSDLCIVGAGAAGITIARQFSGRSPKVHLLESGGFEFEDETQNLYQASNVGLEYVPPDVGRLRFFGGTTNHWAGWCHVPQSQHDFDKLEWIPYSGWPLSRSSLDPYYERAQRICELGPYNYDVDFWSKISPHPLLPLLSGRILNGVNQFSPPTRFGISYRKDVVRARNITTILYGNAVELIADSTGRAVTSIRVATLVGKQFWIKPQIVVLAAGGIENARLLLLSNKAKASGLGNNHDLVGRFFADNYHSRCCRWLPSNPRMNLKFYQRHGLNNVDVRGGLTLNPETLRNERIARVGYSLTPKYDVCNKSSAGMRALRSIKRDLKRGNLPDQLGVHIGNILTDLDTIAACSYERLVFWDRPVEHVEVSVGIIPQPTWESRVRLGNTLDALGQKRAQLEWHVSELDRRSFQRAQKIFAEEIGRAGLGRVQILELDWPPSVSGSWSAGHHHTGTTRMHNDPRNGVVDPDLRIHGISNTYIAGSSVFPTAIETPTLLIVALALRLAEKINERLK